MFLKSSFFFFFFLGGGLGGVGGGRGLCVFGGTFRSGQTRGAFQKTKHSHPCAFRFRKCLLSCAFGFMKCLLSFSCDTWASIIGNVTALFTQCKNQIATGITKIGLTLALCRSYGVLFP